MRLIEAVPNVSEGKDAAILHRLRQLMLDWPGVRLLGLDPNPCANRTVFTFSGKPDVLNKALFEFIALACKLIDMRGHKGTHPRLGAVDVCPLVPVRNISLQETALLAADLGKRVGTELGVPVYLYEAAQQDPARKNLAFIRKGEYESLPEKIKTLPPDFGPHSLTPRAEQTGACVIGARDILIAFNVNLNTRYAAPARVIAAKIRESSGGLKGVKAIGWYMDNFLRAQVSCNITDFRSAPLHAVYKACQKEAAKLGLQATGCELVGLAPLEALLAAGRHYAPDAADAKSILRAAVKHLNLNEVKDFEEENQILEFKMGLLRG